MKKILFSFFVLTTLLFVFSCSNEDAVEKGNAGMTKASFTIGCENVLSRAISDGTGANIVYYATYLAGNKIPAKCGHVNMVNKEATLNLMLASGKTYTFAFWAQDSTCTAYDVTELTNVTVNYEGLLANDESMDAFCNSLTTDVNGMEANFDVVLKRPFAQLNVGRVADATNDELSSSDLTIAGVANTLNVLTGVVSGTNTANFGLTFTPQQSINESLFADVDGDGKNEEYEYLSMNYVLVGTESELYAPLFKFFHWNDDGFETLESPSTPLKRNFRTNIIWDPRTNTIIKITVDPAFEIPDINVKLPTLGVEETEDGYEISNAEGLYWLANQVNHKQNTFKGKTIKLMADIDLGGRNWEPIGSLKVGKGYVWTNVLDAVFDGNNHTISNFVVNAQPSQDKFYAYGLFGSKRAGEIKNLTIDGATINGYQYVGAVVGYTYAAVTNCKVANSTIVCTYLSDEIAGENAGAVVGFSASDSEEKISGCYASDCTVKAMGNAGQIIGFVLKTNLSDDNSANIVKVSYSGTGVTPASVRDELAGVEYE